MVVVHVHALFFVHFYHMQYICLFHMPQGILMYSV